MTRSETENKRTARIDFKVLAAVSAFAAKGDERPFLQGVCVELGPKSTTYVATDGARLLAYHDDVFEGDAVNTLVGTYIIPTAQCRAHKPGKDFALGSLEQEDDSEFLTLEFLDVGVTFKPVEGAFPSWRKIVPQGRASGIAGQFNPELVAGFGKFGKALDYGLPGIAHNGPDGPARVFFPVEHVVGVIMPFRASGAPTSTPAWIGGSAWATTDDAAPEIFSGPLEEAVAA